MKKFNFRLERILQYKIQIEEQKRRELASKMDELKEQNNILLGLTQKRESYLIKYRLLFNGHIDVDELKVTRRFLDKLQHELVLQARRVIEFEKRVEKAKAILLSAMRDRKKYEKLKERKFKVYINESNLLEQKAIDEFASQAASRKGIEEAVSPPTDNQPNAIMPR